MEEINNQDLVEQVETQQDEDSVGQEQQVAHAQKSTQQDENFRTLRHKTEQLQRERDDYYRRLQDIESRQRQPHVEEPTLNPDDLVEYKHLQREMSKIKEEMVETRIRSQYPDYFKVVNDSTIASFRDQYPELARSLDTNKDVYSKATAVYTLIKKFNIVPSDESLLERARIQENMQKPRPLSSVAQQGDSPLSKANAFANGLTDDLRKQLLKEMQEAKKRI